jgi:NitT/TauT family transport system substrate-binding protein
MRAGIIKCAVIAAALYAAMVPAHADDTLKVAVAQVHAFESQPAQAREIFKKHGIILTIAPAHGGADALQDVLSGVSDIAIGVDTALALRALGKGAPLRAVMPVFTGASDLYWYVRTDSPIPDLAGAGEASIAYSTPGSMTHAIVTDYARELKIAGKPVAAGSPAATLTAVMSGKVAVGYGRAPFGLKEVAVEKIRIIAKGNDIPLLRSRTLRIAIVSTETSQKKRDVLVRFVRAWREAADALYASDATRKAYAQTINVPADVIEIAVRDYFPKSALQTDTLSGLDDIVNDAVRRKIIDTAPAKDLLSAFAAIPSRP